MDRNHCGFVVKVRDLRQHPNADKLQIARFYDCDTCVDINVKIGDMGIYFPSGLQLSQEYCEHNNLVWKKDENGNNIGGYLDPSKRLIKAIRLRGAQSDGIFMPIDSIGYTGINFNNLKEDDTISTINGHEICGKYIPTFKPVKNVRSYKSVRTNSPKHSYALYFNEHKDTEQLSYSHAAFMPGDLIEITLKMHGTSQRTGYLPVLKGYKHKNPIYNAILHCKSEKGLLKNLYDKILKHATPVYEWGYVSGTRRTILENWNGGFYGDNKFRESHAKFFEGKLRKGEEVYYEVVGFTNNGSPIMGSVNNSVISDPEFEKMYGKTTTFSYGCEPTGERIKYGRDDYGTFSICEPALQSDFYVYRMTITNSDGEITEYTPDYMRYRCKQMGCKTVPVFYKQYIPQSTSHFVPLEPGSDEFVTAGEWVQNKAEKFYSGPDPIGKTHVREGVVVRIVNRPTFTAYKHKNFEFKRLSGIIVENITDVTDNDIASEL